MYNIASAITCRSITIVYSLPLSGGGYSQVFERSVYIVIMFFFLSSSDETDDSEDIKPDICMAMKREESPVPSILPTTVTNMSWRSVMTSPDLTVLSQSSAESGTAKSKSMELMFSSVIPQDEQEEDCLTSILKPESPATPGPQGDAVPRCATPACTIPGESDDLGSYPFPMGDTLLEYTDDDVGVFTPAYFNPATGMVTLLLPNAGGDN